ncbi:MAG TPA: CBS domain-containing protein [Longimicrobium sp.]|nr:CBS domain-containing protein [Longimicrobium sp.]
MDGQGRDGRGWRRGYDVWYVPDAEPQAGMYPGPWSEGRFTFRRGGAWYDAEYQGHAGEAFAREPGRHPGGRGGYPGQVRGGVDFERERGGGGGYGRRRPDGGYRGGAGDADRILAWEIMTDNPETVTPETPLAEVARAMRDLDVGILPVVAGEEDGRLLGVVTDRDLVVRALADGRDGAATVAECMTTEVETVGLGHTVREVLNVMKRARVRRVPVTDRDGRLAGIIAQADLAVEYAGLDPRREAEVEETIERISEPRGWRGRGPRRY